MNLKPTKSKSADNVSIPNLVKSSATLSTEGKNNIENKITTSLAGYW